MKSPRAWFRSWLNEERHSRNKDKWRNLTLIAFIAIVPLVGLNLVRHSLQAQRQEQQQHEAALDLIDSTVNSLLGTATEWAQQERIRRIVEGDSTDSANDRYRHAASFKHGEVMLLFSSAHGLKLAYAPGGISSVTNTELVRCARDQLLPFKGSSGFRFLACHDNSQYLYLGVMVPVANGQSGTEARGRLVYLRPLVPLNLRGDRASDFQTELLDNLQFSRSGSLQNSITPVIHGQNGSVLAFTSDVPATVAVAMAEDLPILMALLAALLLTRAAPMLERRQQRLSQIRAERLATQRIRRTSRKLDQLLQRLGPSSMSPSAMPSEDEVIARLFGTSEELLTPSEQSHSSEVVELKLSQVASRFERFLASARTLALFDSLTGMPNRRYFFERLEIEVQRSKRNNNSFVIMFIDIDKFKIINDTYGHNIGDAALVAVADRMRAASRQGDFMSRYGGDEFAVLMDASSIEDKSEASLKAQAFQFATRITSMFESTVNLGGMDLPISLSVGITLADSSDSNLIEAIQKSDAAMYQAKKQIHNRISIFDTKSQSQKLDDYNLFAELQIALKRHDLTVMFQPIIGLTDGAHAVEALVRWHHHKLGAISPDVLLSLADRYRLTLPLGIELLELSVKGYASLRASLNSDLRLAINMSGLLLSHPDMGKRILAILDHQHVKPTQVTMEVTEQSVMEMGESTEENLRFLKESGMELSLDDFGTGYSSLTRLISLQPDELKIDKSFVSEILTDPQAMQVVQLVTDLAKRMNMRIVAEGVETQEISNLLLKLGITHQQGFLFSQARSYVDLIASGAGAFKHG